MTDEQILAETVFNQKLVSMMMMTTTTMMMMIMMVVMMMMMMMNIKQGPDPMQQI